MGQTKFDWIMDKINKNMTVYISTYYRITPITKKTISNFKKCNLPYRK